MILSKNGIETLAEMILNDFRFNTQIYTIFTPIDQLASDYLKLSVRYERISDDLSFCGVTAYDDTNLKIFIEGKEEIINIKQNEIILNGEFIRKDKIRQLCGRRRFTLAHEVAHHILFEMETNENKSNIRKPYSMRTTFDVRQLKTAEDWNEWQADYLGAALLMPRDGVDIFMRGMACRNFDSYKQGSKEDIEYIIDSFCELFHVSKSAAIIRLRNLGYFGNEVCYA